MFITIKEHISATMYLTDVFFDNTVVLAQVIKSYHTSATRITLVCMINCLLVLLFSWDLLTMRKISKKQKIKLHIT